MDYIICPPAASNEIDINGVIASDPELAEGERGNLMFSDGIASPSERSRNDMRILQKKVRNYTILFSSVSN